MTAQLQNTVKDRPFFRKIGYSSCWEDAAILQQALQIGPGDRVLSILSGGCNTLSLLIHDPASITALDMNLSQICLLRLKMAAFRTLDHGELLELVGVRDSERRLALYQKCREQLDGDARAFWDPQPDLIRQGLYRSGRTDRYLMGFGLILRTLFGTKPIEGLFAAKDLGEQRAVFRRRIDGRRWRLLFSTFFHKQVITRAKDPAHFRFVDFDGFGDRFRERADRLFTELKLSDNYFLAPIMLGRYWDERAVPPYLLAEHFETVRDRLDRLKVHHGTLEDLINEPIEGRFNKFNLSNLFDWVDDEHLASALRKISRLSSPGGRMCYWNTLLPRPLPEVPGLIRLKDEADALARQDRFIYAHFEVGKLTGATSPD